MPTPRVFPVTILTTTRHTLRPLTPGDLDDFHAIWGDPRVIWWGASTTREESAERLAGFLERTAGRHGLGWWLAVLDATGEVVGDVALDPSPLPGGEIEIGWHFKREHWGYGHATEAAAAARDHAFAVGIDPLVATIVPENTRSVALAERLGMRPRPGTFVRAGLDHRVWEIRAPDRGVTPRRTGPSGGR